MTKKVPCPFMAEQRGLTLVEVLAALLIFSIIGVAAVTLMKVSIKTEERIEQVTGNLEQMQRAMAQLERDLQHARGYQGMGFSGSPDSLQFYILPDSTSALRGPGFLTYRILRQGGDGLLQLERRSTDFFGRSRREVFELPAMESDFGYLDAGEKSTVWRNVWSSKKEYPLALRFRLRVLPDQKIRETIIPIRKQG